MIRLYIVLLQLLGVLFINLIFGGDVSMKIDAPGQIPAGKEILVQVTLSKGKISGFSRFQVELPAGITATNVYSANADFSFKDQKVRFIWLRLPDNDTIIVKFNIQSNEYLKGNFDLSGKFSYIDNNERKGTDIQPQNVTIIPSSTIDPRLIVDIKDFGKSAPVLNTTSVGEVACIRQKPAWSDLNKEYMVTLLVNKESLKKFAKIEELVPAGFMAVNMDSKDGIFTFKDKKVKFLWMNLPAEPYFTVSYKLVPLKDQTVKQPVIAGTFSYILDDKTQSVNVIEKDVNLANLTPELVRSILLAPIQPIVVANVEVKPVEVKKPVQPVQVKKPDTVVKKPVQVAVVQPPVKVVTKPVEETSDLLEPQAGVYYRVQIAAGHRPVNVKRYFNKYKLDNTIFKEQHQGWIKYSVGTFAVYKDARDYRVHIWNTTTIADAFVAAYNSGKRITVQEGLMIGNQRWYQ